MFTIQTKNRTFLPFSNETNQWQGNFYFIQGADTQFGMESKISETSRSSGCEPEVKWSKQMIDDIHQMSPRPRFLVICGDLLDAFPITQDDERDHQKSEFSKVFKSLNIPLVCVCGNHDVGNQPTYKSIDAYRSTFGDDYYSFWCAGVFFIVLNSQVYEDSSLVPLVDKEQEVWLEEQLKIAKDAKHTIVFQHIPYFLRDPNEGNDYFNIEPKLRMKLLDRLYDAGVRYIFTGHYHRNAGGHYKDMELIVTSAVGKQLGDDTNGYRIVKVFENHVQHEYIALGTAPASIEL